MKSPTDPFDMPDTVSFSGGELADLIAASIEQTVALDTPPKRKIRTLRTSQPSSRPSLARPRQPVSTSTASTGEGLSIAPMTYTPPTSMPRMMPPPAKRSSLGIAKSAALGTFGMLLGLVLAICGWELSHRTAAAATEVPRAKRGIVDQKVALASAARGKAVKKPMRRLFFVVPPKTAPDAAPAPPEPGLDKLGDAQLNAPF